MMINVVLFFLGFASSILLFKPLNNNHIDECIYIKICAGDECLINVQFWVIAVIILFLMYSNNDAIGGLLSGIIILSISKEIPKWI